MSRPVQLGEDTISLYPEKFGKAVQMVTYHPFFKEPVICKVKEDRLEFTHPTIDYRGKIKEPLQIKGKDKVLYRIHIMESLTGGRYEISEESDEDKLIVYFSDIVQ